MDPAMMEAFAKATSPGKPHEHLAEMAGDYTIRVKSWMEPGAEPMTMEGTAHREMVMGGRHLKETVDSEFMGRPFHGLGMTGYDNAAGHYWTTWIDNVSTGVMMLTGDWSEAEHAMVFEGDFVDPMTGDTLHQKVVSKMRDDGSEYSEFFEVRGGQTNKMMEMTYTPK